MRPDEQSTKIFRGVWCGRIQSCNDRGDGWSAVHPKPFHTGSAEVVEDGGVSVQGNVWVVGEIQRFQWIFWCHISLLAQQLYTTAGQCFENIVIAVENGVTEKAATFWSLAPLCPSPIRHRSPKILRCTDNERRPDLCWFLIFDALVFECDWAVPASEEERFSQSNSVQLMRLWLALLSWKNLPILGKLVDIMLVYSTGGCYCNAFVDQNFTSNAHNLFESVGMQCAITPVKEACQELASYPWLRKDYEAQGCCVEVNLLDDSLMTFPREELSVRNRVDLTIENPFLLRQNVTSALYQQAFQYFSELMRELEKMWKNRAGWLRSDPGKKMTRKSKKLAIREAVLVLISTSAFLLLHNSLFPDSRTDY